MKYWSVIVAAQPSLRAEVVAKIQHPKGVVRSPYALRTK